MSRSLIPFGRVRKDFHMRRHLSCVPKRDEESMGIGALHGGPNGACSGQGLGGLTYTRKGKKVRASGDPSRSKTVSSAASSTIRTRPGRNWDVNRGRGFEQKYSKLVGCFEFSKTERTSLHSGSRVGN